MANIPPPPYSKQNGATESTPLLAESVVVSSSYEANETDVSNYINTDVQPKGNGEDEIPRFQVLLLCFVRLFEPIAFFAVFPFVNQMIYDTGEVSDTDVGFYSGLIESIFSLTQVMVMIPWGRLADHPKIGRKPVLVVSTIGIAICTALFGTSRTIWQMFLYRCSAGVFAGSLVTIRTMLAENSTKHTQARIFGWFAVAGNLGIFIGPLVGGALSDPARQYPRVFGHVQFFKDYPYALPTLVCGALGIFMAAAVLYFVDETLKIEATGADSSGNGVEYERMSILDILRSPGVAMVLFLQSHIMMLAFAYTAVMPVFFFTPIHLAGFGLTPPQISVLMGVGGLAQAFWMLLVFPRIQTRYSTGTVIRACARAYPFFFLAFPILSTILRHGWTLAFWIVGPILLALGSGVAMSFAAIQLCVNDVNPKPETLGTLNSLALSTVSGIRAFSPGLFTAIFAVGIREQILGGYLLWLIMTILAAGFTLDCHLLPANAEGKLSKKATTQSDGA